MFLSMTFGLVASTLLTRMLVATLMRQHRQVERNARLLAAVFDNLDVSVIVRGRADSPAMMNRAARALHEKLEAPVGVPTYRREATEPQERPRRCGLIADRPLVVILTSHSAAR